MEGEKTQGASTRERLLTALRAELLGPEEADEVLQQPPGTRYLVGMLAPQGTAADPTEDDSLEGSEGSDEEPEESARVSASLDPSSIGISCAVEGVEELEVEASWGEYEKGEDDEWRRRPVTKTLPIPIEPGAGSRSAPLGEGVTLEWTARVLGSATVVSVFLLNCREVPDEKRPPDDLWLYQPKLLLRAEGATFLPKSLPRTHPDPDPDIASADLIYSRRREFATGHGVAAEWSLACDASRAEEVWTEMVPGKVVPIVEPRGSEGLPSLSMDALAECEAWEVEEVLSPLLASYEEWISGQEAEIPGLSEVDAVVAGDHMRRARRALGRMRAGVKKLAEDPDALAAFQFANAAMAEQRRRTVQVRYERRNEEAPVETPEWRPFQIGFILLCLPGMVDPAAEDRTLADLLWFPTGGGKTEAYLGLTAFTFAHRRLRKDEEFDTSCGTAVLMRYTLRLLTIQQFGRALTLLCACERLREAEPERWGDERFTIGLWVGQSATPNNYEEAKKALRNLRKERRVFSGSPYQVLYCPWCGHDIAPADYYCDDVLERTLVICPNPGCDFSRPSCSLGLPVLLVDEEIYRNPPSLLLATVDKFAQMAWNGRIQSLYGRVERWCPRHGFLTSADDGHPAGHLATPAGAPAVSTLDVEKPLAPPELIIQDELHLISGPLGTLVGIYEAAVEGLCCDGSGGIPAKPKVIASTATIRRADRQIESLFAREAEVFPPLGIDASDSFFAREADPEKSPGRLYVGVYAPGKSIKTALVRVYATLLSRSLREYEADPSPTNDAYMTLVGYFNSIRELGGALRLVDDDVPARLRVLRKRGFGPRRLIYEKDELTAQKRSSDIPEVLEQLDRTFAEKEGGLYPLDVLLASNMISVGVDIDRLGLMVVSGQPKTTAEYIQATSRVGRVHPGLVVEVYNWSRPRDTSHYERFRHYHETFYRHVEATSVTPFSSRARDRALAGVLTSYVRLDDPGMSAERSADNFDPASPSVQRIVEEIVTRSEKVTQKPEVAAETELQLKNLLAEWAHWAGHEKDLSYAGRGRGADGRPVLLRRLEYRAGRGIWPVANSLREVEAEVDVVLKEVEED
ncbi:MAG TPA: DISARM system helicase DrmA [Solirubrobacterales bacterium]